VTLPDGSKALNRGLPLSAHLHRRVRGVYVATRSNGGSISNRGGKAGNSGVVQASTGIRNDPFATQKDSIEEYSRQERGRYCTGSYGRVANWCLIAWVRRRCLRPHRSQRMTSMIRSSVRKVRVDAGAAAFLPTYSPVREQSGVLVSCVWAARRAAGASSARAAEWVAGAACGEDACSRYADDLVVLIDGKPWHRWLVKAVYQRLLEELAKTRCAV